MRLTGHQQEYSRLKRTLGKLENRSRNFSDPLMASKLSNRMIKVRHDMRAIEHCFNEKVSYDMDRPKLALNWREPVKQIARKRVGFISTLFALFTRPYTRFMKGRS